MKSIEIIFKLLICRYKNNRTFKCRQKRQNIKTKTLILVPIILMISLNLTYPQDYKLKELTYYKKILPKYQEWLNNSGFSNVLKVNLIELKNDKLYFLIKSCFAEGDSAKIAWLTLKQKYDNENEHELEELLYFNAINAFKVKPEKLVVEILDNYENPCIWVELSFDIDKRKIIKRQNLYKTNTANFTIDIQEIKNKSIKIDLRNDIKSRNQVYINILQYAKREYSTQNKGKDVIFRYEPGNNEKLVFTVIGLRQEVLKAENNIWIGKLLNWKFNTDDYDWRKVEVLKFTIKYRKANYEQIYIDCEIDGRYGSGYYKTTDWNKCIPMNPEFNWYLQDYTNNFRTKIYELLSNK